MMAFTNEDCARGAAYAFGHPVTCVLLRQPGDIPGHWHPRRLYTFRPSGDTSWTWITDARTMARAIKAADRLRESAYYRWWVKPPEVEAAA